MTGASRRRGEQGAAAIALLVTAVLVGLTIFVSVTLPYGTAVDAKARNRTAADAAALAGAIGAREALLASLGPDGPPGWQDLPDAEGLGLAEAEEYAVRNGGRLVSYRFDPLTGTAHATVEGDRVEGAVARSDAVAQVDLPSCETPSVPTPTPSPTPPADEVDPAEPAEPPPPVEVDVDCGPARLRFRIEYREDGGVDVTFPPGQADEIREVMDARLIG